MMFNELYSSEKGVLTFEWILLITLIVIGVIAGLATVRDALNVELGDISQGVLSVNQEFMIYGLNTRVNWTGIYSDGQTGQEIFVGMSPEEHFVHPSEFNDTSSGSGAPNVEITTKAAHGMDGADSVLEDSEHSQP